MPNPYPDTEDCPASIGRCQLCSWLFEPVGLEAQGLAVFGEVDAVAVGDGLYAEPDVQAGLPE